jgi:predicted cupin superfamily sugar epimerase
VTRMHPDTEAIIRYYKLKALPVEGTLFMSTYRSVLETEHGEPVGTAMLGLYSDEPYSVSCFHRLTCDEIWHVYGGDPFLLVLLHPDGSSQEITMGTDFNAGQRVQFVIPAGVWQAGYLRKGGRYALFGCTCAPGFTSASFEAGGADELIRQYPTQAPIIERLNGGLTETHLPDDFAT